MAPSATTMDENGSRRQCGVARRVVQRSSTLLVLKKPYERVLEHASMEVELWTCCIRDVAVCITRRCGIDPNDDFGRLGASMDPVFGSRSGLKVIRTPSSPETTSTSPLAFIENDAISIGTRFDRSEDGIRLEIENDDCSVSVTDKPPSGVRRQGNSVVVLLPGNIGDRLARLSIDDHRVGASRDVETAILGIQGDVVHAALTTNMKGVFDRPGSLRGDLATKRAKNRYGQKTGKYISRKHEILRESSGPTFTGRENFSYQNSGLDLEKESRFSGRGGVIHSMR
jgi:hypothetical protein